MPRAAKAKKPQPTVTDQESAATEPPANDRDSGGRFAKGNAGGPGNPHARHCARMLTLIRNCISDEEMVALFRKLYEKANAGDMGAAKIIVSYKIGKPGAAPEPDLIDRDEWDHYQKDALRQHEMELVMNALPSSVGNDIVRTALPIMTTARTKDLAAQLMKGCPIPKQTTEEPVDAAEEPEKGAPIPNGELEDETPADRYDDSAKSEEEQPLSNGKNKERPHVVSNEDCPQRPPTQSPATSSESKSTGKKMYGKKIGKKKRAPWLDSMAKKLNV